MWKLNSDILYQSCIFPARNAWEILKYVVYVGVYKIFGNGTRNDMKMFVKYEFFHDENLCCNRFLSIPLVRDKMWRKERDLISKSIDYN